MRVLVDARPAVDARRTGVGRYARALLRHLPPADPNGRYVAWYLDPRGIGTSPRRFSGWSDNLSEHASRIPAQLFGPITVRAGLPRVEWLAGRSDLVLATNFLPPATAAPTVLMVHDVAFDVLPGTAPHHDAGWRQRFDRALRRAAAVIVPSRATREDLLRLHAIDADRVVVIHHGIDRVAFARPMAPEIDTTRRRYGIDGPYALFLGGLEPRKNLETLVRAFGAIEDRRAWLVIAGGVVRWAPDHVERVDRAIADLPAGVRARVVRTGYVPDRERLALLLGAQLLVFPSRYEGFGFPILEGFAAGVPVMTSNVSAMPEVAGEAALLVDPEDRVQMARALDRLLSDEGLRDELRAAGDVRVGSFSWERCATETASLLHRAHDASRTPPPNG